MAQADPPGGMAEAIGSFLKVNGDFLPDILAKRRGVGTNLYRITE